MKSLQCVKGMHDILPGEIPLWQHLESTYRALVENYGYAEIRTPILESQDVFLRGIGEATDIVEKEMYAFVDKGGDALALRPEGTASAIRAYLQHSLAAAESVTKLYYVGPMFRRERPAKGRYRQFYQAGAELIGVAEPAADAEIIDMAVQFVRSLGISNVRVQINSLGDSDSRPRYRDALVDFFSQRTQMICGDCQRRLTTNPLRILDCKVPMCRESVVGAPSILEFLSDPAAAHFAELQRLLTLFGVHYDVVPTMVRGLDYYTGTIFEIQGASGELGAQSTIVGGGRYNDLVARFGGRPTPTIGFAFGIERLLLMIGDSLQPPKKKRVFVAGVGDDSLDRAMEIARRLRQDGISVETPYRSGSLRSQLKRADKSMARLAVIAGADEAARGAVTIRDLETGAQEEIPLEHLLRRIEDFK